MTETDTTLLNAIAQLPLDLNSATNGLIEIADRLMTAAIADRNATERRHYTMVKKLMASPTNKRWATQVTDRLFRTTDATRTRKAIAQITQSTGYPSFLSARHHAGLRLLKWVPSLFDPLIVRQARAITQHQFRNVVLSQPPAAVSGPIRNFNSLGEAIFGTSEARQKLHDYLELLTHPDCQYISVKISSLVPNVSLIDAERSLEAIAVPLRTLYRAAMTHSPHKTVTLDMEEYKDLLLTVGVFKKVLSESEFQTYRGGIVLQAYIPDTTAILETLKEWAIDRYRNGSAPIRIRIVKGANRAMELVESEISGHPNPLFTDKIDTDAHFKSLILACCATDARPAIDLGIATHNIFDLTFALWIRHHHHPTAMIEMLQGMADDLVRVLIQNDVPVLVYTPIATPSQYLHAVAYLIRRLDENTGSDHFLGVAHSIVPGDSQWRYMATLFQKSIDRMRSLDTRSRRTILEIPEPLPPHDTDFAVIPSGFVSAGDSDWTLPATVAKLRRELRHPMPLATPPHIQSNQLQTVVQTAVMGHDQWHRHPDRDHLLMAWADQLEDHRLNLSHAMVTEVHKTATEADAEVSEAIDFIRYYLRLYQDMRRQFEHPIVGKGPTLVCPPWNFPLAIPVGAIAANLIVGNSVIFKPAPEAKGIGQRLAELAWVSGIPQYALQCIALDDADGQQLVNDPSIATVMLTGSTQTAHHFLDWRPDLNLIAETGGKNTIIVSGMCDRDLAIRDIVQSAFGFSGQKCSAASVLILEKSLYDDPTFITHLKEAVEAIPNITDSQLPVATVPLIRPPSPELLEALTALDIGEEWVVPPKEIAPKNWTPGLKRGSQPGSRSATIEFFGPVLSIIRATSMSEAIAIANQSQYGLTAGLHSLDPTDISEWVTIIRAGNLYVNRTTTGAIVGRQPFGGTKASCIGNGLKAGGPLYLTPLVHPVPFNHHPYVSHLVQWLKKMTLPQRTSRLSGQTNTYWLKHRENQYLIIDGSTPKETAVLAAQIAAQFHVPIQLVNPSTQLFSKIHDYCPTVRATKRDEIAQHITTGTYGAIRWIGPLPLDIRRTANANNIPLFAHPLGDHALWELPRWLREVSLSHTTHRFGNTTMGSAT